MRSQCIRYEISAVTPLNRTEQTIRGTNGSKQSNSRAVNVPPHHPAFRQRSTRNRVVKIAAIIIGEADPR